MPKHLTKRQRKEADRIQRQQEKRRNSFWNKPLLSKVPGPAKYAFSVVLTLGLLAAAPLLMRQDRQHVPQFQSSVQSAVKTKESIKLHASGWRVFVDYPQELVSKLDFQFINMASGDTIGISGSNVRAYKSGLYCASIPMDYLYDASRRLIIPLNPLSENRIVGKMYAKGTDNLVMELDTIIAKPVSYRTDGGNCSLITENPHSALDADALFSSIGAVASLLPGGKSLKVVLGDYAKACPDAGFKKNRMEYGGSITGWIVGSQDVLKVSYLPSISFHESSHLFMYAKTNMGGSGLKNAYLNLMEGCGFRPYPGETDGSSGVKTIDGRLADKLSGDRRISLVLESSYVRTGLPVAGHAYSDEGELFASMSVILMQHHKSFFERVESLRRTDPAGANLLYGAAREVLRIWGSGRIFPKEVYQKLGLQ